MISKRLNEIKRHVKKGLVIADIGCDHAFLSIDLIREKIAKKVYACDIARGPLSIAKDNIQQAGLSKEIDCVLSDGLDKVPGDVQGIIIAGMGGQTAIHILEENYDKAQSYQQIILQVNRGYEELRRWLFEHHFLVEEEWVVYDRKFYYLSMSVRSGHQSYLEEDVFVGPILKKSFDPVVESWFRREVDKAKAILPYQKDPQYSKRIEYYQHYLHKKSD